jgi:hypothetical protein
MKRILCLLSAILPIVAASSRSFADGNPVDGFTLNPNTTVNVVFEQPDGKILIGGEFVNTGMGPRSHLARFGADGSIDATFNPGANADVYDFAVQPDGKILVAGQFATIGGESVAGIARLPDQVTAIRTLLPETGRDPAALSAAFGRQSPKREEQIAEVLEVLESLGQIERSSVAL